MPKTGIFDDTIVLSSFVDLREKITALQYMRGDSDFATTARNLLTKAVEAEIESLPLDRRRYFEQIRQNVRAATLIRKQKREESRAASRAKHKEAHKPPESSESP